LDIKQTRKIADAHCAPLRANGEITMFCRGGHWPSEVKIVLCLQSEAAGCRPYVNGILRYWFVRAT